MTEQAAPQCYRHPGRQTWISCQRCGRPICPDCMVPAAVGFQCPSCVHEGQKTVRQARTVMGGRIPVQPGQTTIVLIAINAFLWLLTTITGGQSSTLFHVLSITPRGSCVPDNGTGWYTVSQNVCSQFPNAHWVPGALNGAPWELITSAFMHVALLHIASNMLSLWFIGPTLEAVFGRARYLALYFFSALTGSLAVVLFAPAHTPTLGASGAIFGLLGALLLLSRRTPALFNQVVFWVALNLVFTFSVPGISWQAHLGGLAGGAAMTAVLMNMKKLRRSTRSPF